MPANKTAVSAKARYTSRLDAPPRPACWWATASASVHAVERARVPALWATLDRQTGKLTGDTYTWRGEADNAALMGPIAVDGLPQHIVVALDDRGVARETESAPFHNEHLCVLTSKLGKVAKPMSLEDEIAELRRDHAARLASTRKLQAAAPKLRRVK